MICIKYWGSASVKTDLWCTMLLYYRIMCSSYSVPSLTGKDFWFLVQCSYRRRNLCICRTTLPNRIFLPTYKQLPHRCTNIAVWSKPFVTFCPNYRKLSHIDFNFLYAYGKPNNASTFISSKHSLHPAFLQCACKVSALMGTSC